MMCCPLINDDVMHVAVALLRLMLVQPEIAVPLSINVMVPAECVNEVRQPLIRI